MEGKFRDRSNLTHHKVYKSLMRRPRFMGVEKTYLVVEGTLTLALIQAVGISWSALGIAVLSFSVIHPLLAWATKDDPEAINFFTQNLFHHRIYEAQRLADETPPFIGPPKARTNNVRQDSILPF